MKKDLENEIIDILTRQKNVLIQYEKDLFVIKKEVQLKSKNIEFELKQLDQYECQKTANDNSKIKFMIEKIEELSKQLEI